MISTESFSFRRVAVISLAMISFAMSTGCSFFTAAFIMAAPRTQEVAAEYSRMPEKRVVVYVWAPAEVTWDYPKIRLDLAAHLSAYLAANVEKIDIVDPYQVESYLEEIKTTGLDPADVGKHFDADLVVHVSLLDFTIREPEMAHFYRGRLTASIKVFDLKADDEAMQVVQLHDVAVLYPEGSPVFIERATPMQIRQETYEAFALQTGRKFHDYDEPLD